MKRQIIIGLLFGLIFWLLTQMAPHLERVWNPENLNTWGHLGLIW